MTTETSIISTAEDMEKLGERIGQRLKGGEVIELVSDLGGGKTTLVRGLARGVGSSDVVGSPTFTLSKVYRAPVFEVFHFDFYRLHEAGLMAHELQDLLGEPHSVVVVEWGDVVQHVLPEKRLTLRIDKTPEGARKVAIICPDELAYLTEGLG